MLIDVGCNNDRSILIFLFGCIKEAISDGSLPLQFTIKEEVIFSRFKPSEIPIAPRVYHIQLLF